MRKNYRYHQSEMAGGIFIPIFKKGKAKNMGSVSKETRDKWIQAIKDCGQSLIDNAEKIAGDYDFQRSVYISIDLTPGEVVEISVDTRYLPKASKGDDKIIVLTGGKQVEFIE